MSNPRASKTGSRPKRPTTSPGVIRAATASIATTETSHKPAIGAIAGGYRRARSVPSATSECTVVDADQGGRSSNLGLGAMRRAQFTTDHQRTLHHCPHFLECDITREVFKTAVGC